MASNLFVRVAYRAAFRFAEVLECFVVFDDVFAFRDAEVCDEPDELLVRLVTVREEPPRLRELVLPAALPLAPRPRPRRCAVGAIRTGSATASIRPALSPFDDR